MQMVNNSCGGSREPEIGAFTLPLIECGFLKHQKAADDQREVGIEMLHSLYNLLTSRMPRC